MTQPRLSLKLLPANEVCEGYVFTGVCLSMGEGGLCPQGVSVQGGLCPGGSLSTGGLCPGEGSLSTGESLSAGVSVQGVSVQGVSVKRVPVQGVSVQGDLLPGGLCLGISVQGGSLSRGSLSGRFLSGGLCPRGYLSKGVSVQGSLSGRPPHTVTCRRYLSYWNAFLFQIILPYRITHCNFNDHNKKRKILAEKKLRETSGSICYIEPAFIQTLLPRKIIPEIDQRGRDERDTEVKKTIEQYIFQTSFKSEKAVNAWGKLAANYSSILR